MSDVVVVMGDDGRLSGLGDSGGRAYARFKSFVSKMSPGETIKFSWWEPRSPQFHRRFFAKLNALFDRQEQFADVEALRAWLTVGAGECQFVPGPTGRMVAIPRSIRFERMDDTEFSALVGRIDTFLWTDHAQAFLWPHLSADDRHEAVNMLSIEFS